MRRKLYGTLVTALVSCLGASAQEPDSDRDGLSDFQETHKYHTDPRSKDSDRDGVPDGDWDERREYAYTIRSIVRVIPPCGRAQTSDDYQDARILKQTKDYVELEVIHYPLATAGDAIGENPRWRRDYASMKEHLKPRINTNWNAKMRRDLLAELKAAEIDIGELTDKEVVEQVSRWFVQAYEGLYMFNALHVHYPNGRVAAIPGRERVIAKGKDEWTLREQFEHELLGRSMYYHKTRGTCTSSAMALTTVLRAVGIPTRMILTIPVVDGSDEDQVAKVRDRLTHHQVRAAVLRGVSKLGNSFASHTFNEVFVGGRWHRLNYNRLGQPILDGNLFGLLTHVHTFNDLSEWGLQPTWGAWAAKGRKSSVFAHNNPYATIALSDRFGQHAEIPNTPVRRGIPHLTITKAYWFHSADRPKGIGADAVPQDGSGHMLVHVEGSTGEGNAGEGDASGNELFEKVYRHVDKDFVLKAAGGESIPARARRGCWGKEFYIRIARTDWERVRTGVPYSLHAKNAGEGPKWKVKPGLTITRPAKGVTPGHR